MTTYHNQTAEQAFKIAKEAIQSRHNVSIDNEPNGLYMVTVFDNSSRADK